ncbi:Na+/H+ antiporter subunit A [Listeria fleischmannii]|uniref:Na+/H+ antiporter subunit A n=1 Tax=Listeria fleischmannii TaxID=1069827 RepID=A0A841YEE2_9LIST|nr:Na+/H+ antiporter subunit A [Listeria fleischmannii]EIA20324.1 monovalent cation/H+ antiporter subunit A [Listeria fleischmannii subsp. coloradonensis]MBC1398600.1 Na+/H+ antiporter subunit A [Listeria fleischmannii]MBC1419960.1 Na+/H+ antiporter subunit A [Listeria fleischmannii]MBC1426661.1 Na+/H+ antiporter subunit A [Listeria fleischmannii]STY46422.1 Multiple resistance and pH homeostasis protein A [Listeria fleischmannii subsp. coloradonensis]
MSLLHLAIILPFVVAMIIPIIYKWTKKIHTGWLVLPVPIILFIYFLSFIPKTINGSTVETFQWIPRYGINFTVVVDGLSLLFALLITGIGSLVVFYSIYYLGKNKERLNNFYAFLMIFMTAMLGVVLSDNLIVLYLFWELTSISSFLLIGYWYHRERSRYGARKSMMITVFGGLMMLGGFIMLHIMTDSFSIREILAASEAISQNALFIPAMILILLGAFTKSAQVPFHIWLPDAMEAPTPVSAYLHSATMVKAGIYIVARFTPLFALSPIWFWTIAIVGTTTLLWGSINATKKNDLKAILAYSTISQLGLIMTLLGIGAASLHFDNLSDDIYVLAIVAAVFHLFNHATFKGSLFMMVGIIDHETGTRDIRRLGGLMRIMPITATIAFIGTFAMAGLPPFNGFLSKEMFLESLLNLTKLNLWNADTWGILLLIVGFIASVFTFTYSMIIFFKTFTGKQKAYLLPKKPHEAPFGLLLSPAILAFLVLFIGIFPNVIAAPILEPAVKSIVPSLATNSDFHIHIGLWHGITPALLMTVGIVILGIIFYKTHRYWKPFITTRVPKKLRIGKSYDKGMSYLELGSYRFTMTVMTGWLRTYLNYMLFAFIVLVLGSLILTDSLNLKFENLTSVTLVDFVLAAVILVTLIGIVFSKSRITSIILLGAMGYTISIFFVIARAPDLALTQLIIETISVVLYLLVFYHLPQFSNIEEKPRFFSVKTFLSIGIGITITLVALSAYDTTFYDSISQYYIDNTYKEAAGKNIVNVILVDFRGFDTLFETTVLAIASIGIFTMIKLRLTKRRDKNENQ